MIKNVTCGLQKKEKKNMSGETDKIPLENFNSK